MVIRVGIFLMAAWGAAIPGGFPGIAKGVLGLFHPQGNLTILSQKQQRA